MKIDEVMRELECAWEAGSLPGKQSCEHNVALRALWQAMQRRHSATRAAPLLELVRS